jgi:hypothetical protein
MTDVKRGAGVRCLSKLGLLKLELLLLSALLVIACKKSGETSLPERRGVCIVNCTTPRSAGLDGSQRVDRVARSWLIRGEAENSSYAYYVYLVFSEKSEATAAARRAAMHTVAELFVDVERSDSGPGQLAVLGVPISESREDVDAAMAMSDRDIRVRSLLEIYNYEVARNLFLKLIRASNTGLPPVMLVGYPHPLLNGSEPDLSKLYYIDLSKPEEVEAAIRRFVLALETNSLDDRYESVAESSSNHFSKWGRLLVRGGRP